MTVSGHGKDSLSFRTPVWCVVCVWSIFVCERVQGGVRGVFVREEGCCVRHRKHSRTIVVVKPDVRVALPARYNRSSNLSAKSFTLDCSLIALRHFQIRRCDI